MGSTDMTPRTVMSPWLKLSVKCIRLHQTPAQELQVREVTICQIWATLTKVLQ